MSIQSILAEIDAEIKRLREVRALLSSDRKVGKDGPFPIRAARKKRKLSAEGRQKIAEAQRKRWVAQKKGIDNCWGNRWNRSRIWRVLNAK
jgi:hypothetical protein